ncbi:hypothetical protein DXA92_10935 [Agathobaculum butyriciproducens]|mgnify:FL=1|nr:hypothetical protein DXA94_02200 [Agathobaculum butyriciproducens]RGC59830.1 hypothetical protein DXA92_10935 [Agathobaculum butyriciproducens]
MLYYLILLISGLVIFAIACFLDPDSDSIVLFIIRHSFFLAGTCAALLAVRGFFTMLIHNCLY